MLGARHVVFIDKASKMTAEDIKKLEEAKITVVIVDGNPNQVTRRETFIE